MKNLEIALAFERIASLLEVLEESPFKIRAYRRAARTLMEWPEPIEQVANEGRLRELPGVGEAIAAKIQQYLETGTMELLERLRQQVPEGVLELMEIPGIGARTARLLYEHLGVSSLAELEAAARAGRVRTVKGMGARTEQAILEGIERWRARAGKLPLPYLLSAGEALASALAGLPGVGRVALGGSVRRALELGSDVDLIVEATSLDAVAAELRSIGPAEAGMWEGTWRVRGRGPGDVPVDLWVVPPERYAAALWVGTGPREHVDRVLGRLAERGWRLEQGRLVDAAGAVQPFEDERDVYRRAGYPWVAPELRWGEDELERAERGQLPGRLVEVEDILGDLHTHTRESDGTASAAEMAEAARARGLGYIAITDHSPSLGVARGLSVERLRAHLAVIEELDRKMATPTSSTASAGGRPTGFRVLSGTEVDVLPDGRLDYPDEVLQELDVVVASIHTHFRMGPEEMTARLLRACEHPAVRVLGHPSGRLLGRRDPYRVDLEAVLRRAAETKTAVEINGSPDRLDLSWAWARRARELGALLVISTDAHSPAQLGFLRYGVLVARRAGLEPRDILNTLPSDELLRALK